MIKNFADRETEKVYRRIFSKKLPQAIQRMALRKLMMDAAEITETPKMSEILAEEFMLPLGISAYKLAKDINVPVSRIQDILHDRRRVSADTSIRLGKYFGVSSRYFLNLQDDIDVRNIEHAMREDLEQIKTIQYV
jgi:addiction module antidote protein HigA